VYVLFFFSIPYLLAPTFYLYGPDRLTFALKSLIMPSLDPPHRTLQHLSPLSLRSETLIVVLDLARILATLSPKFGTICTPDALLTACDWSLPHSNSKVQATNTLLALRTFANLFTTPTGRKGMVGMKVQEWLDSLRRGRSWEEVGARRLPYVTIVLKYVFLSSSSFHSSSSAVHSLESEE